MFRPDITGTVDWALKARYPFALDFFCQYRMISFLVEIRFVLANVYTIRLRMSLEADTALV